MSVRSLRNLLAATTMALGALVTSTTTVAASSVGLLSGAQITSACTKAFVSEGGTAVSGFALDSDVQSPTGFLADFTVGAGLQLCSGIARSAPATAPTTAAQEEANLWVTADNPYWDQGSQASLPTVAVCAASGFKSSADLGVCLGFYAMTVAGSKTQPEFLVVAVSSAVTSLSVTGGGGATAEPIADGTALVYVANARDAVTVTGHLSGGTSEVLPVQFIQYPLSQSTYLAATTNNVWASGSSHVTPIWELSASTGAVTREVEVPTNGMENPNALAAAGKDLWVLCAAFDDHPVLAEVSASGQVLRILEGPAYGFDGPVSVTTGGGDVFVANSQGNSVSEVSQPTGRLVRIFRGKNGELVSPFRMAVAHQTLWVTLAGGGGVTFDTRTGKQLAAVGIPRTAQTEDPQVAYSGGGAWVTSLGSRRVSRLGATPRTISFGTNHLLTLLTEASNSRDLFVLLSEPDNSEQLREYNGTTGALVHQRKIHGAESLVVASKYLWALSVASAVVLTKMRTSDLATVLEVKRTY